LDGAKPPDKKRWKNSRSCNPGGKSKGNVMKRRYFERFPAICVCSAVLISLDLTLGGGDALGEAVFAAAFGGEGA